MDTGKKYHSNQPKLWGAWPHVSVSLYPSPLCVYMCVFVSISLFLSVLLFQSLPHLSFSLCMCVLWGHVFYRLSHTSELFCIFWDNVTKGKWIEELIWWDDRIKTEKKVKLDMMLVLTDNNNIYWEKELAQILFI